MEITTLNIQFYIPSMIPTQDNTNAKATGMSSRMLTLLYERCHCRP